jgi:hypothetical protein
MPPQDHPRSIPKALSFIAACIVLTTWTISILVISELSLMTPIAILLELSLSIFLFYRTLTSLHVLNRHTVRFDVLFYQDRKGSLILIFLSAIWAMYVFALGALSLLDLLIPGGKWWGFENPGFFGKLFQAVFVLGSPVVFVGIFAWLLTTAAKALWRISAPSQPEGQYREVPLVVDDDELMDDGEWDSWKGNTGSTGHTSSGSHA